MGWIVPPRFLAIDIETAAGNPADAEEWARRCWTPSRSWKPATIGERYLEAVAKKEELLALMDSAPIVTVALRSDSDIRVLHWMPVDQPAIAGVPLERYQDERAMLAALRDRLDQVTDETLLIGHNIRGFDLPKLRYRMLRCGLRLPTCLVYRDQPVYDTMAEWARFTTEDRKYVGMSELMAACGIEDHKIHVNGAQVPGLFASGQYETILSYAAVDVAAEWDVAMRMLGLTADQDPGCGLPTGGHAAVEEAAAREVAAGPSGTTPAVREALLPPVEAKLDVESLLKSFGV